MGPCFCWLARCSSRLHGVRARRCGRPKTSCFFPTGAAVSPGRRAAVRRQRELRASLRLGLDLGDRSRARRSDRRTRGRPAETVPDGCSQDPDHSETLDLRRERSSSCRARARASATSRPTSRCRTSATAAAAPDRPDPRRSVDRVDRLGRHEADAATRRGEDFALCDENASPRVRPQRSERRPACPTSRSTRSPIEGFAIVTHLTTGAVTLIDSPHRWQRIDRRRVSGLFAADPLTGLRGATGVAGRGDSGLVYVGSRSEDRIQTLTRRPPGRTATSRRRTSSPSSYFFLDAVGATPAARPDTRGMAFSASGDRMYLINRRPPSLQVYDTSLGAGGAPATRASRRPTSVPRGLDARRDGRGRWRSRLRHVLPGRPSSTSSTRAGYRRSRTSSVSGADRIRSSRRRRARRST